RARRQLNLLVAAPQLTCARIEPILPESNLARRQRFHGTSPGLRHYLPLLWEKTVAFVLPAFNPKATDGGRYDVLSLPRAFAAGRCILVRGGWGCHCQRLLGARGAACLQD